MKVTPKNTRKVWDLLFGWYDLFFVFLFVSLVVGALVWIVILIGSGGAIPFLAIEIDSSDRFGAIVVLVSVLISGFTAVGLWWYTECVERYSFSQSVKSVARSIADAAFETWFERSPDKREVHMLEAIAVGYVGFPAANMRAVSMLESRTRRNVIDLFTRLSEFNILVADKEHAASRANRLTEQILVIAAEAVTVARQLDRRSHSDFDALVEAIVEEAERTGTPIARAAIAQLQPYYQFS